MTDRELMQQALDALVSSTSELHLRLASPTDMQLIKNHKALTALRERLAQPEQEPVGYFQYSMHLDAWVQNKEEIKGIAFYTSPPQRKPLTEEEIEELSRTMVKGNKSVNWLCRALEAAHDIGEKE